MDNLNYGQPKSKFRLSKKLFGCPIKPAKRTRPPRLRGGTYGRGGAEGPQKLWGKWCKILHSGHILAHKSQLQIVGFFLLKFLLDKSQGTQKLWIKRCKNMQSGHFRSFLWSSYSFWQSFLDFFARGFFALVTNFHMFEKRKFIKYK